ncbi:ZMAT4 protein, partial [Todus mexicanus]|nr:ZMAT4 protein [Todus mexicanus]
DDILHEAMRKDLFTGTFCKVCGAVLQSQSQRSSHYKGKRHAKNVRLYIQRHGEKAERQEHGKEEKGACIRSQMDGSGVVDSTKYCNLCNVFFTSPVVAMSHYVGKVHARELKQLSGDQAHVPALHTQPVSAEESSSSSDTRLKLNVSGKFCKLCSAPFSDPLGAQQHYEGKRHRRNETRKKLLEELGDGAFPAEYNTNGSFFSAFGVGYYECPICNVTLTSIETYVIHMQGNKHQMSLYRERFRVSVRKESKRTYDSIQDKLTVKMDYIKVQRATGLEPRKCSGKAEEEEFQDKNIKGRRDLGEVISSIIKCEQDQCSSLLSESQPPKNTGDNRSSKDLSGENRSSACEHALKETPNWHYNKGYCKEEQEEQACEVATITDKSFSLSIAESKDCLKLVLAETSTSFYRKEQKFQMKEEKKYVSEELKFDKTPTKQKRKMNSEGADVGKENEKPKRIKSEINSVSEEKSRPKDKRRKGTPAEKEQK